MKIFILPYKRGSRSVRALKEKLTQTYGSASILKLTGSNFAPKQRKIVVNYGNSGRGLDPQHPVLQATGLMLNGLNEVGLAANKLHTLTTLSQIESLAPHLPEWTQSIGVAEGWLEAESKVCVREKLTGHSGEGLSIASTIEELIPAPLYTKYIPKKAEYRVHVFKGEVFDIQRKMRNRSVPDDDVNWQIRNHGNGFIFGREGVSLPDEVHDLCVQTVEALGLDFGAVDLIYNEHRDMYYVLEVNTAVGLEGTTLEKYAERIASYAKSI